MSKLRDELPFMSFAVDAWLADTAELTAEQYATLHRLHCHAWRRGGSLPTEKGVIARMVGCHLDNLEHIWPVISRWFDVSPDTNTMTIQSVTKERTRALELREKKRRGALLTNNKRWAAGKSDSGSDSESESVSQSDTHSDTQSDTSSQSESLSESHSGSQKGSLASRPSPSPYTSTSPDTSSPSHTVGEREGNGEGEPRVPWNVSRGTLKAKRIRRAVKATIPDSPDAGTLRRIGVVLRKFSDRSDQELAAMVQGATEELVRSVRAAQ